jgi:recombination associated protein RdgC
MWFKQVQVFQLNSSINFSQDNLTKNLETLAFRPCLPSMEASIGWVSPIDNDEADAILFRSMNSYIMLCLQIEEKILPATVIRHELTKKIKKIALEENRRVRQSEKLSLKDELKITLLPRAFTKFSKIYAYIDTKSCRVILGTASKKRTDQFINLFKKSVSEQISPIEMTKLSPIITHWIKNKDYPPAFSIEKTAMLQDPNQQSRVIRCQHQDLFSNSILSLIKDGCEVKQLAMNWQDRVNFVLSDDFHLKSIRFQDEIKQQSQEMEPETKEQQFDADFLIMTETISQVLNDLLNIFRIAEKNTSHSDTLKNNSPILDPAVET